MEDMNSSLTKLKNINTVSSIMNWLDYLKFHSITKMLHKAFLNIIMFNSIFAVSCQIQLFYYFCYFCSSP